MPLVFYHFPPSPPSRAGLTVAKTLGLDVTVKIIDLFEKQHLTEEYLKINPQHTVPAIDDNGLVIGDSNVIATYLVSRYGKDDSLYPKDVTKRVLVDQRLYFNALKLFGSFRATIIPILFGDKRSVAPDAKADIYEALGWLEKYLQPTGWVAGDHGTVADICCSVTAGSLQALGVNLSGYPKIRDWLKRCRTTFPGYEETVLDGEKLLGETVQKLVGPKAYAR